MNTASSTLCLPHLRRGAAGVAMAAALLALAGCGSSGGDAESSAADGAAQAAVSVASSASFDESIEDTPCKIVTKATVASVFGVPAAEVEQDAFSSSCEYEWEGQSGQNLNVSVYVTDVYASAASAAEVFENATRSMSAQEVAAAMGKLKVQMNKDGKLETKGQKQAAAGITGAIGAGGFTFVDVPGVGDQARFDTGTGELKVRVGNLRFDISAYMGPGMPMPDTLNGKSIMTAHKAWMAKTMEQRKQAAVKLAKAAIPKL